VHSTTETRTHNPACERSKQTGREAEGRVPKGRNAEGGRNSVRAQQRQRHKKVTNHAGVAAYLKTLDNEGMCAKWLWYVDHGEPGRQGIGYSKVTTSAMSSICPHLCENASVVLGGCSVGKGPPGDRYLTELLNACPRIYMIKACKGDMHYDKDRAQCGDSGQEDWNVKMRGAQ